MIKSNTAILTSIFYLHGGGKMSLNKEKVDYFAELAKIGLSEEEKNKMVISIQKTVTCMDKLKDINTENVKPMDHISAAINVFREDSVLKSLDRDIILSNAPEHEDGCYIRFFLTKY